jgi:hypothetical protein
MLTLSRQLEIHIGYVYGDKQAPPNASAFTPKFVPGARIPHAWIKPRNNSLSDQVPPLNVSYVKEFTPSEVAVRQYSTLDLCSTDAFTLLVPTSEPWTQRFEELQTELARFNVKVQLWIDGEDFEFNDANQKALFQKDGGFGDGGALLVRPDQHIVGRLGHDATLEELKSLVLGHLGL